MSNTILTIDDTVNWKGSWGTQQTLPAKVKDIEIIGLSAKSIDWDEVNSRDVIVTLDNGHWAYGFQISQLTK